MTILSITNPVALPPLPEPSQDPALKALKADPLIVAASNGAAAGGSAGTLSSFSQGRKDAFPRTPDATGESVVDAKFAAQNEEPIVDTIQATRDTAAALPPPLPTSPALRDALAQSAKDAARKEALTGEA